MKKIVFGITDLNLGGAERVLVDISNELINKYDVTIFTLYGNGKFEKQLNKKVKLVSIYNKSYKELNIITKKIISIKLLNKTLRNKLYKKYIKDKYDVEIAFLEGPITWLFSEKSKIRKIAWIHNDIENVFGNNKKAKIKQILNKEIYLKFNELIFVSQDNLNKFKTYFKTNNIKKRVIYNYLDCKQVINKSINNEEVEIDKNELSFIQVSRLVKQKAVDRLIDVHKKLIDNGFKHNIYIVGDGPLHKELQNKINKLGIEKSFILLGSKENPYPYIKAADYFLLTSYYEGYPMVLLEGRALNKYIIITDSAARETIMDYDNKLILENNEEGIYEGIKSIIEKRPKCKKSNKDTNKKIIEEIINVIEGD